MSEFGAEQTLLLMYLLGGIGIPVAVVLFFLWRQAARSPNISPRPDRPKF